MHSSFSKFQVWIAIVASLSAIAQASTKNDSFYIAGVVEFYPIVAGMSSADMVREHLRAYLGIIHSPAAIETDILVFPEGTLNNALQLTYVPDPNDKIVPCQQKVEGQTNAVAYADFLVQLSCAARNASKYVVINLTEKENCTKSAADPRPCAANGLNIYNTNVVFDRAGCVISRYRKVHLYMEAKNSTFHPEFATFDTDFGVRFGHFICFDILFYTPAQELVRRFGITDFIFTSWFYSELPFLTAVQLQQSWAWGNNVNMLAAGASYPAGGTTGTGIYAGQKGHLLAVMTGKPGMRQLFVGRVPKMRDSINSMHEEAFADSQSIDYERQTGVTLMRDPQIENFTSELIDFQLTNSISQKLCTGEFCCTFDIETEAVDTNPATDFYKYRIGIFNGTRTYMEQAWSDRKICAIYACTNKSATSCGEIFDANAQISANFIFKSINIDGDFKKAKQLLIKPSSLDDRLYPLNGDAVKWSVSDRGSFYNVKFSLNTEREDLLTFGIYADYYETAASVQNTILMSLLLCCTGLVLLLNVKNYLQ